VGKYCHSQDKACAEGASGEEEEDYVLIQLDESSSDALVEQNQSAGLSPGVEQSVRDTLTKDGVMAEKVRGLLGHANEKIQKSKQASPEETNLIQDLQ